MENIRCHLKNGYFVIVTQFDMTTIDFCSNDFILETTYSYLSSCSINNWALLSFFITKFQSPTYRNQFLQFLSHVFCLNSGTPPSGICDLGGFWLIYLWPFGFLAPKDLFQMIWLSNILALSVPDEGYSRNALNLISTFWLSRIYIPLND